jgi:hypothetical protein
MRLKLAFNKYYALLSLSLFIIEVYIALYVHDAIVRPYVGDLLVVILLYCLAKTFVDTPVVSTAIAVLVFSYIIEWLQYLQIVNLLGLQHNAIARTVIGTTFQWGDILAYTLGILVVLLAEKLRI